MARSWERHETLRHYRGMQTLIRYWGRATALILAGAIAAACGAHHDSYDVPMCLDPNRLLSETCNLYQCGTNSPSMNAFPINGLRPDGECNFDGIQLMPGSMRGGKQNHCQGATLDFEDEKLIGRARNGAVACSDEELEGASFVVRSWRNATVRIRVDQVTPYVADNKETRTAYRLVEETPERGAAAAGGARGAPRSLCTADAARDLRQHLQLDPLKGLLPDPPPGQDVLVPVRSELYNVFGIPFDINHEWRRPERDWLNLACVDGALAERSFYDLYTDSLAHSRAALMMLTANYCGDHPFTMRGVRIEWNKPDPAQREALWGEAGALCLTDKPRLLYKDNTLGPGPHIPSDLPEDLKDICEDRPPNGVATGKPPKPGTGKPCTNADAWTAAAHVCAHHAPVPTSCDAVCPGGECDPRTLASSVVQSRRGSITAAPAPSPR